MALTELGQVEAALPVARRAYALHEQIGNTLWLLDALSGLAFKRGSVEDADRILGRADSGYTSTHYRRGTLEKRVREKLLIDLRRTLSAPDLRILMREGELLSDDKVAQLALQNLT